MKKQIIIGSVFAVTAAVAAGSTLAYFTAEDTAENVISTGNIDIKINEYKTVPDTDILLEYTDPETPVMPGDTISKIVKVENTGSGTAYIRAKINMYFRDNDSLATEPVQLSLNTTDWEYNETDGYYYYKNILDTESETTPLFESFTIDSSAGNEYENQTLIIDIDAQAIQEKNNDGFH